ncbi:hypothetical protein [Pseudalkalibacillus sp. SCS-8]|uniref:hypothetical protein n=1 Tax=Pseudalkalibacillus nanhaiensis TaxID=3115291 RepID=UPI0032D9BE3B
MYRFKWIIIAIVLLLFLTACAIDNTKKVTSETESKITEETVAEEEGTNAETVGESSETGIAIVVEQQTELLTEDFLEYNDKYYTAFKNNLDLIGGNFELIYEGNYSSNLIDDLIIWTNEFDELLDVYTDNAKPTNELDKKLYSITIEMITKQREANKFIKKGLENTDDDLSWITAGEYLNSSTKLFLEGYELIN